MPATHSHTHWALLSLLFAASCAGPNTPFGAVDGFNGKQDVDEYVSDVRIPYRRIGFYPARQILHKKFDVEISLPTFSKIPKIKDFKVYYNELEVSKSFLKSAKVKVDPKTNDVMVTIPKVYLNPRKDHDIEVHYTSPTGKKFAAELEPPQCNALEKNPIHHLDSFNPPEKIVNRIVAYSTESNMNPALVAGLIAQESGFRPDAVSWAKAIGLTQVTAIAEKEILKDYPGWPQHPGLKDMSVAWLRTLIRTGSVSSKTEWRLHPERSIKGGITYLKHLDQIWSERRFHDLIHYSEDSDFFTEKTKLILASYNSGFSNVLRALKKDPKNWLNDRSLKEAKKYVNRVFSYCYYFSEV